MMNYPFIDAKMFFLLLSALVFLALLPHFIFPWYLAKIKNKHAANLHVFLYIYSLVLLLAFPILDWLAIEHGSLATFASNIPTIVGMQVFLWAPLIWLCLFVAAAWRFKLSFWHAFKLFVWCTAAVGIIFKLWAFLFYLLIEPNIEYCPESFLCWGKI